MSQSNVTQGYNRITCASCGSLIFISVMHLWHKQEMYGTIWCVNGHENKLRPGQNHSDGIKYLIDIVGIERESAALEDFVAELQEEKGILKKTISALKGVITKQRNAAKGDK